jgi:hypothetical protein
VRRITFPREPRSVHLVRHHGKIIYWLERKLVQIEVDGEYRIGKGVEEREANLLKRLGGMERMLHRRGVLVQIGRDRLSREGGAVKLRGGQGGRVHGGRVLHSLFRRKMRVNRSEIYDDVKSF